jgi:release factor glutamine methyltransferase
LSNEVSTAGAPGAAGNVADCSTIAGARARGIARLDAEVLLSALCGLGRAQILAFGERPVDALTAAMYQVGLERLSAGEPLAYITGIREFWSLPLVVTPDVLIPRPETELIVERCIALLTAAPHQVADLGTGSGAIALALARERPAWQIMASDLSSAALEVAAVNRQRLQLDNVQLHQGRWCAALPDLLLDAILSNPPYIAAGDPALAALGHEPQAALVAGEQGFADLLEIADGARAHLLPGGLLLLEHGSTQAPRLREALVAMGYDRVASLRDLAGHERVTEAFTST